MNKVRELKIDSTLWATPAKIVNLLDIFIKDIFKVINGGHGELKLHEKIILFDNGLPIEHVFKIPSVTIVIMSLIEKNNKFYLKILLNHCLYKL